MNYKQYMDQARSIFHEDYRKIIEKQGILPPSVNKSPIYPPMSCVEYDAMEKDTAKYFLYYAAISCALKDLKTTKKYEILKNKEVKLRQCKKDNLMFKSGDKSLKSDIPQEKVESKSMKNEKRKDISENDLAATPEKIPPRKILIPSKKLSLENRDGSLETLKIMVIGAGRGRLVEYCYDGSTQHNIKGIIHVLEANVTAYNHLKEKFSDYENIIVYDPVAIRTIEEFKYGVNNRYCDSRLVDLAARKPIDMIVSELLGSFADNEFCPEILETCVKMFGKSGCVSIPECYTIYVCAISSQSLETYFKGSKNLESLHLLGLPKDAIILSDLVELYTNSCSKSGDVLSGKCNLNYERGTSLTGVAGYFILKLYEDILIDTCPCKMQNTFFWETAFFPVDNTAKSLWKENCSQITFKLSRKLKKNYSNFDDSKEMSFDVSTFVLSLWYEWLISAQKDGRVFQSKIHNQNGATHSLHL